MYADLLKLEEKLAVSEFPLNVAIEVTNFCNLNCIMCGNNKITRPRGYMDMELYKKIIDEIADENPSARIWLDFYGEALLAGFKLYYMIDYAKKKGLTNVCINTNGTLLKKEYANMLLDAGADYISIDCDGYTKEVFEKIRVGSDRDVFYKNIEYLLNEKKRRNEDVIIEVKVIEMDENKEEILKIVDYWRGKGAWTAVRRRSEWVGMGNEEFVCADEDRVACGHVVGICAITWNGDVADCVWDGDVKHSYGNVSERTIKDIWRERNNGIVAVHMEHRWNELPNMCRSCITWKNVGEVRNDENGNPIEKNYGQTEKIFASLEPRG